MYVNKCMSYIIYDDVTYSQQHSIEMNTEGCRGLRYLAYRTLCSSTTFEGTGGDVASKTLACKYGAVPQKIRLECIKFSVRLQKFQYGSDFSTQILVVLL